MREVIVQYLVLLVQPTIKTVIHEAIHAPVSYGGSDAIGETGGISQYVEGSFGYEFAQTVPSFFGVGLRPCQSVFVVDTLYVCLGPGYHPAAWRDIVSRFHGDRGRASDKPAERGRALDTGGEALVNLLAVGVRPPHACPNFILHLPEAPLGFAPPCLRVVPRHWIRGIPILFVHRVLEGFRELLLRYIPVFIIVGDRRVQTHRRGDFREIGPLYIIV